MTIDENQKNINQSILNTITKVTTKSSSVTDSFADLLKEQLNTKEGFSGAATTVTAEQDTAIAAFKEALSTKGALQFYQDYNNEKIEKLVEAKKDKLTDTLGLNDDAQSPLLGEERQNALANLDQMTSDYQKDLIAKLGDNNEQKKANEILSTFLQELS